MDSSVGKAKYKKIASEFNSSQPVFARMPDWNPAEIIGARPNHLAYSLYKKIITDNVWAIQRYENGFIDMRGYPLMSSICGQAYVCVNYSISSFIPDSIHNNLKIKISQIALNRYINNRKMHDKLEFEIIPTSYDLDEEKWKTIYRKRHFYMVR